LDWQTDRSFDGRTANRNIIIYYQCTTREPTSEFH
jgi:hypothetical protein